MGGTLEQYMLVLHGVFISSIRNNSFARTCDTSFLHVSSDTKFEQQFSTIRDLNNSNAWFQDGLRGDPDARSELRLGSPRSRSDTKVC